MSARTEYAVDSPPSTGRFKSSDPDELMERMEAVAPGIDVRGLPRSRFETRVSLVRLPRGKEEKA